ncbi:MAG: LCP family protein [Candidatus Limnocylindrales bacterium]
MLTPDAQPVARHSSFAAAFLSFLLPGLGQMYCRRFLRGLFWMVPWLVAVALVGGIAFSMGLRDFGARFSDTEWLWYLIVGIGVDLLWRLLSLLDAWWVARAPAGETDAAARRVGSLVGLLAIVLVLLVSHAAVGRQVYSAYDTLQCISGQVECEDDLAEDPGVEDPEDPEIGEPGESFEPLPSLLPPVETTPPANGEPTPEPTPEPQGLSGRRLNILLVGTNGSLTDTMMVVSIDRQTGQVGFISMPRDTVGLRIPGKLGLSRAYDGVWPYRANQIQMLTKGRNDVPGKNTRQRGYNALKAIIGESIGLDIDYYVQVNMNGFMDAVDALGGAMVDVQLPLYDSRYNSADGRGTLKLYQWPGFHHFDGGDALAYARSRHASSDLDRGARQQRAITAIRNQLDISAILQPGGIDEMLRLVRRNVRTDIPPKLFPALADLVQKVNLDERVSVQLGPFTRACQQRPSAVCDAVASNRPYGLEANIKAMRTAVKDLFDNPEKVKRIQELASEGVVVEVLNGTKGTNQRTTRIADYLVCQGIDASVPPVNGGAADRNDYDTSVITVYNGTGESATETIKELERRLKVDAIEADDPEQTAGIVVIVGKGAPSLRPDCNA